MKQIMILLGLGRASADVDSAGCVEQAELLNGLVRGPRRQSALLLRDAGIDFGRAKKEWIKPPATRSAYKLRPSAGAALRLQRLY